MKKMLLSVVMSLCILVGFSMNTQAAADTSFEKVAEKIPVSQYYKVTDDGAVTVISESEAAGLKISAWNVKTVVVYSAAKPSTAVVTMQLKYSTVIAGGRPQFEIYVVSAFSSLNGYICNYTVNAATGDYVRYNVNYSKTGDSGTKVVTFTP